MTLEHSDQNHPATVAAKRPSLVIDLPSWFFRTREVFLADKQKKQLVATVPLARQRGCHIPKLPL